jgi:hypothetical protein
VTPPRGPEDETTKITRCATAVVEANCDYTGIPRVVFHELK